MPAMRPYLGGRPATPIVPASRVFRDLAKRDAEPKETREMRQVTDAERHADVVREMAARKAMDMLIAQILPLRKRFTSEEIAKHLGRSDAEIYNAVSYAINMLGEEGFRIAEHMSQMTPARAKLIKLEEAERAGLSLPELEGQGRRSVIVRARQLAMYRVVKELGLSYPQTGRLFGGRDHSTVIHAVRAVERRKREEAGSTGRQR